MTEDTDRPAASATAPAPRPEPPDFEALAQEIETTVRRTAGAARETLPGYSRDKARAIAGFTLMIGEAYAAGRLSEAQMARELAELDRMVMRFVRMITALANTLAEALVGTLSRLLRGVLDAILGPAGLVLPTPG